MRTDLKAESPGTDQRINRSADNPKRRMAVKTSHGTRRVGSDGALPQWPAAGRLVTISKWSQHPIRHSCESRNPVAHFEVQRILGHPLYFEIVS